MSTPRDRLAEGRRLRAAADLEQATVPADKPWPATVDWLVWSRNNAGVLIDTIDAFVAADPDLFDEKRIDPDDGWEHDLSEAAYETYGGSGRQLRDNFIKALDTAVG